MTTDLLHQAAPATRHRNGAALGVGLVVLLAVLAVVCVLSITLGTRGIGLGAIVDAFRDRDDSVDATVIREMRVPRTLIGLCAGAALGLAGALLQGLTRNPLADPGIMGVNTGASAFIVSGIALFGTQNMTVYIWFAFAGAAVATVLVYGVASFGREGATPVKLALAGAAVSAGFYAITTGVVVSNVDALNQMRFWQVGALSGRYWDELVRSAPFIVAGIAITLLLGRALNGLALGDDMAVALGQRVGRTRAVVVVTVTLLAGAATAACGPIVFIGLVVPHVARALCGPDYRWILPYTLVLSPIVLLAADVIGRLALQPGELQVGVVLGIVGAPAFIALVRNRSLAKL